MQQLEERVRTIFGQCIELMVMSADQLSLDIAKAAKMLVACLLKDSRIMLAGCGGSAANLQHFANAMIRRYDVDRPALPVINLNTDAMLQSFFYQEGQQQQYLVRQIQALGREGDVLMILSTSGSSECLIYAVQAAKEQGMDVLLINGRDGGVLSNHIGPDDIDIRVQGDSHHRIREVHLFIVHCLADLIDQSLFGQLSGIES